MILIFDLHFSNHETIKNYKMYKLINKFIEKNYLTLAKIIDSFNNMLVGQYICICNHFKFFWGI